MITGYIEFNGKHVRAKKENRCYADAPAASWVSYGCSYSSDFLKLDVDDYNRKTGELEDTIRGMPKSEAVIALVDAAGLKYNGIKTEHGAQLFFRVPASMPKKTVPPWYSVLGVELEWKSPESDDHIPLVINGIERQFFKGSIDNTDVDELPFYLSPLQKSKEKPFLMDFPVGNRTQHLGGYLFHLVEKKGFTAEQAFEIVRLMNEYIFENPKKPQELEAEILNDSTMKKLLGRQKTKADKTIGHAEVGQEIAERLDLITLNKRLYSYQNGVYKPFDDGKIGKYLSEYLPHKNSNFEKEVIRHVKNITYTEYPEDDGAVNVTNGVLHFAEDGTVELFPHTKENISFRQFNAAYMPEIQSKLLDDTLQKWFNGSKSQIDSFDQLLGYLLVNHVRYQKVFFFVGAPSTGKTTSLMMIRHFCGEENVSAIQLVDMSKEFGLASIVNKTANVFTDLQKTKVLASATFKALSEGSPVKINEKHVKAFDYCFTGKLIFGMNSYPDFSNDFEGVARRIFPFTFKNVFGRDNTERNINMLDDLSTDECMSALLNRAIRGYKKLLANKGFTETKESSKALNDFVHDNNNVMRWIHEEEITEDYLLREPIRMGYKGIYPDYQKYCSGIGESAKEQKDFSREICGKYGFETYTKRINGERPQMYRKK